MNRYNSEGHIVNVTFPTAEVSSFYNNMEKSVRVEVDSSSSENFITVTNFSSSDTIFTFHQGMSVNQPWVVMYSFIIDSSKLYDVICLLWVLISS